MTGFAWHAISERITSQIPAEIRKAVHNFSWLWLDQVLRTAIGFAVNIWLTRFLGPTQLGEFNYCFSIAAFTQSLAALELDRIVVRDLSQRPEASGRILGTACVLRLVAGAIGVVAAVLLCWILRPADNEALLLVAIMAPTSMLQSLLTIDLWFQSRYSSKYTVQAKLFSNLAVNFLKLVVIATGAPLSALAATVLAEAMLMAGALIVVYRRNGGEISAWSFDRRESRMMLHQAATLMVGGFAIQLQARADIVMMGRMLGDRDVGFYTAALRIIESAAFLPVIMTNSIAPLIAKVKSAGEGAFANSLLTVYKLMGIIGWAVAIPLVLLADPLITLLYGERFAASGPLLALLGFRFMLACFGSAKSLFIINQRLLWLSPIAAVAGAVINIGLNFILIPRYGAAGAIVASLISFTTTIFVIDLFWRSTRPNFRFMMQGLFLPWTIRLSYLHATPPESETEAVTK